MAKTEKQQQKQSVKQVVKVIITDKVFGKQKRRGNKAKGRKRLPRRSRIMPHQHIRYSNEMPSVQSWYGMKDILNKLDIKEAQGLVGRGRREQLEPALRAEQRAIRERQERGFVPPQPSRQSQEEQYQRQMAQQKLAERSLSAPSLSVEERRSDATTIPMEFGSRLRRLAETGAGTGLRRPQPPRNPRRTPREFEEVVLGEQREKVRQADIQAQLQRKRREERTERRALTREAILQPTSGRSFSTPVEKSAVEESRDLARSDFTYSRDPSSVARLPPPDIFQRAGQEVVAPVAEE